MPDTTTEASTEKQTCPHGVPQWGYFVTRPPEPNEVSVHCPCCHCPGVRDANDLEPMPCPHCGVNAVLDNNQNEETH
jgi:hypothetical protein